MRRAVSVIGSIVCAALSAGCALPLESIFGPPRGPNTVGDDDPEAVSPGASAPKPAETTSAVLPGSGPGDGSPRAAHAASTSPSEVRGRDGAPPAVRYAALGRDECEAELTRRGGRFDREAKAPGVSFPIRLTGPLSGVWFRSMGGAAARRASPYEVLDCRLALAIDDFARVLARHGVVEVVHYSMWRPANPKKHREGPGKRHPGGLAIDAAVFKFSDGRELTVDKDFKGTLGTVPCGDDVRGAPGELRDVYCEAASERMFNVMLSPHYNRAHKNHFHLEVTTGVTWTLVR